MPKETSDKSNSDRDRSGDANLRSARVEIFLGTGGVGKTTLAAAKGLSYALSGKKTLVMTIDPSVRLARALNVPDDLSHHPVPSLSPNLFIATVPHKKVFDDFVLKASGNSERAQKLLKNKLYQQLTSDLAGSQDFSSLQHLYSAYTKGGFDIIILDTPPAQHVVEFLDSPKKLGALFEKAIFQWLAQVRKPKVGFISRMVEMGTKQALKVVEMLTGSEFVQELLDFFASIEDWRDRLQARVNEIQRLLQSADTEFCVVTGFDSTKLAEAKDLAAHLASNQFRLRYIYMNRAIPFWWPEVNGPHDLKGEASQLFDQFKKFYDDRQKRDLKFSRHFGENVKVIEIPECHPNQDSLAELRELAAILTSKPSAKNEANDKDEVARGS